MRNPKSVHFVSLVLAFATLGSLTAPASRAGGFELTLAPEFRASLGAEQRQSLDAFVGTVRAALPPSLMAAIGAPVQIQFLKLDDDSSIALPTCTDEAQVERLFELEISGQKPPQTPSTAIMGDILGQTPRQGSSKNLTVRLTRNFLPEIYLGPDAARTYPCGHRNLYRLAVATLVHELTHVYDFLDVPANLSAQDQAELDECQDWAEQDDAPYNPRCDFLTSGIQSVSKLLSFRNLMGWNAGLFRKSAKNRLLLRSPDPYEFTNLQESFAVNMEYFALDPEFRCRRPEIHQFLVDHFGYEPPVGPAGACKLNTKVRFSSTLNPVEIDPERIYAIHYLLAEKGEELDSRWGHAMFRLIVCAPTRKEVGPDCVKDIASHVVVSFRANVSGTVTSYWDGIFGKYPSELLLYSMPEINAEYAVGEARELKSVPLKLSRDELRHFTYRVLQEYWDYQGRYYFLGNNCATETLDFFKGAIDPDSPLQGSRHLIVTPMNLYTALKKAGLLDESVLTLPDREGRYVFSSFYSKISEAFATLQKRPGFPPGLTLKQFISDVAPAERARIYRTVKSALSPSPAELRALAAQFYLFEVQIREHLNDDLKAAVGKLLDSAAEAPSSPPAQMRDDLSRIAVLRAAFLPWFMAGNGYGIPPEGELLPLEPFQKRTDEIAALMKDLNALIRTARQDVYDELDAVAGNIQFLLKEVESGMVVPPSLQQGAQK